MNLSAAIIKVTACSLFIAITAGAVHATGSVVPGTTRSDDATYQIWQTTDSFGLVGTKDRSYHCRAVGASSLDVLTFNTSFATSQGTPSPTVNRNGTQEGTNVGQAFSFIATGTGQHSITFATSSGLGTGGRARANITCNETTLYGNFNTVAAANPVNYLEVKNISTATVNYLLIISKFDGTELSRSQRSINAGTRQDIAIHDIAGASDTFGSITIGHDGMIGALQGNVSKYTFDGSSLNITATESMTTRVQN